MKVEEKLNLIADALDVEPSNIGIETDLNTLDEWDSMGVISVIAMLDRKFKKVPSAEEIENLTKIQDILDLMQ